MRPVIIVPGIGGSALVKHTRITKSIFSKEVIDNRWVNLGLFSLSNRWKDDMLAIKYKRNADNRYIGMEHGDTTVTDFGGIRGITNLLPELHGISDLYNEALDPFFHHRYFGSLCDVLIKEQRYKEHHSLFGAPYDFRVILDKEYRDNFFIRLQHGIEHSVHVHCEPCVIVTHSFGGVLLKWFLSNKSQEWISKHIHRWVCVSAPFGGSFTALMCFLPHNKSIFFKDSMHLWERVSGVVACFPNIEMSEPLVKYKDGYELHVATYQSPESVARCPQLKIYNDLMSPHLANIQNTNIQVPVTFVYNVATATPYMQDGERLRYTKGDGVVTEEGLMSYCGSIKDATDVVINNCNHTSILLKKQFHHTVLQYL